MTNKTQQLCRRHSKEYPYTCSTKNTCATQAHKRRQVARPCSDGGETARIMTVPQNRADETLVDVAVVNRTNAEWQTRTAVRGRVCLPNECPQIWTTKNWYQSFLRFQRKLVLASVEAAISTDDWMDWWVGGLWSKVPFYFLIFKYVNKQDKLIANMVPKFFYCFHKKVERNLTSKFCKYMTDYHICVRLIKKFFAGSVSKLSGKLSQILIPTKSWNCSSRNRNTWYKN